MAVSVPVEIYSLSTDSKGAIGMETAPLGGCGQSYGPFSHAGALYVVLQTVGNGLTPASIWVFTSADDGATWSILDQANSPVLGAAPVPPNGSAYWDEADTITVCYNVASVSVGTAQALQFQDFDLVSKTWGAVYGTAGAPSYYSINQVFKRSDGSVLVLHNRTKSGATIQGVAASVFSSGAWGVNFNVDTNVPAGSTGNGASSAVYDPATGAIHVFMQTRTAGNLTGVTYQKINLDNTLGTSFNFTNEFKYLGTTSSALEAMTNPVLFGDNIVFGVLATGGPGGFGVPSVLVGTPISAPVWSVLADPGIDTAFQGDGSSTAQPYLATDGTTLYATYVYNFAFGAPKRVTLAQTLNTVNPTLGWSAQDVYVDNTTLIDSGKFPSLSIAATELLFSVQSPAPGATHTTTSWFLSVTLIPPPTITCVSPPQGKVGASYSHAFPVSGGTAPYAYAITVGALPAGLTLNSVTGIVSGTPTTSGTYAFTIQVTDANAQTGSVACSIQVVPGALKITLRGVKRTRKLECEPAPCIPEPRKPRIDRVL